MLKHEYSGAMANLKELEELGCIIMHEVDAKTMSQHAHGIYSPVAGEFVTELNNPMIKYLLSLLRFGVWS